MSIDVMREVWNHAPVDQGTFLVLLALADNADEETRSCYPGVKRLAQKSRLSERQVQYCIKKLRKLGIISVERNASPVKTNLYTISHISCWQADKAQADTQLLHPPIADPETQLLQVRDEVDCVSDTKPIAPKPSVTSEEPSDRGLLSLISEKPSVDHFEHWWQKVWPKHHRKTQKTQCGKKYRDAVKGDITPERFADATRAYLATVRDDQYLPAPIRFFNQEKFLPFLEDEQPDPDRQRFQEITRRNRA